jgi:hypothetical protein
VRYETKESWKFVGLVAVMLLWAGIILFGVITTIVKAQTTSACLRAGYPGSQVSWSLDRYCIRRVDQTDIVVPFSEIKK